MKKLVLRSLGVLLMTIGLMIWFYLSYNIFVRELNDIQILNTYPWGLLSMSVLWVIGIILLEKT